MVMPSDRVTRVGALYPESGAVTVLPARPRQLCVD